MVSNKIFAALSVIALGGGLLIACSSDDSPTPSGSSSGSSGTSSSSGTSGTSSGTSGTSTTTDDAGGKDAEDAAAGSKENGEPCTVASDTSTECKSGICRTQGGGGGGATAGTFCTIKCDTPSSNDDPKCSDAVFSGRCGGKGYCEVK